jgi:hypothetical protein
MYPTKSIISQESISGPAYQDHHRLERQLAQSPLLLLDLHLTILPYIPYKLSPRSELRSGEHTYHTPVTRAVEMPSTISQSSASTSKPLSPKEEYTPDVAEHATSDPLSEESNIEPEGFDTKTIRDAPPPPSVSLYSIAPRHRLISSCRSTLYRNVEIHKLLWLYTPRIRLWMYPKEMSKT